MGCRNCGVPLDRRFEGHQRIGDGLGHLGRGAVIGQLGVRVAFGLVDGRHDGGGHFFGSREVIAEGRGDGVVGLLRGVRIAREAQGPVVVGELDARDPVAWRLRTVLAGPGVDQVGGAAEGGDLCKDSVDADCRVTCSRLLRSPAVAKGPAFWRARISVSCPSRRASWRACPAW